MVRLRRVEMAADLISDMGGRAVGQSRCICLRKTLTPGATGMVRIGCGMSAVVTPGMGEGGVGQSLLTSLRVIARRRHPAGGVSARRDKTRFSAQF